MPLNQHLRKKYIYNRTKVITVRRKTFYEELARKKCSHRDKTAPAFSQSNPS